MADPKDKTPDEPLIIEREEHTLRRVELMPPGWKRTRVREVKITLPKVPARRSERDPDT